MTNITARPPAAIPPARLTCIPCHGTGELVSGTECPTCRGSGLIPLDATPRPAPAQSR